MSSFAVNAQLLGRTESIEIGYDEKIYDKVCAKFHLSNRLIDCYFLDQLLDREVALCDTNLTANDNIIRVTINRKSELYFRASKIVKLNIDDDAYSSKELYYRLLCNEYTDNQYEILIELFYLLKDFYAACLAVVVSRDEKNLDLLQKLFFHFVRENRIYPLTIFSKYVDINISNQSDITPLLVAINCGHFEIFKFLLDSGADINTKNGEDSPISLAAKHNRLSFVEELMERGAEDISRAFMRALQYNREQIAIYLIDKIEDPKILQNLLESVVIFGTVDIFRKLVDKGVAINSPESLLTKAVDKGKDHIALEMLNMGTPVSDNLLYLAAKNGCEKTVSYLIDKGITIDDSTIMAAACQSNYKIVDKLLENGANVNARDQNRKTLLAVFLEKGWLDHAIWLIKNGADANVQLLNSSPLYVAIKEGRLELLDLLLNKGVDIDAKCGSNMETSLIRTINNSMLDVAEKLIDAGADPNIQDSSGNTALIYSMNIREFGLVRKLLNSGANPNLFGEKSPLYISVEIYETEIFEMLLEKGAKINDLSGKNTALLLAVERNDLNKVKKLVKLGADPNINGKNGKNCLLTAITREYRDNTDIVSELIDAGADLNVRNNEHGHTPLMIAIFRNNQKIIDKILEKSFDINIRSDNGSTALLYSLNNYDTAVRLLEAGADPNIENNDGVTPIAYVLNRSWCLGLYEKLISHGAKIEPTGKNLHQYIPIGPASIIEDLLAGGANVDETLEGETPLMVALRKVKCEKIRKILKYNPNVDYMNDKGESALIYAVQNIDIDPDIVFEIIDRSKDLIIGDAKIVNWQVLERLVDLGVVFVDTTIDGETLLMRAIESGNFEKAEKLIEMGANVSLKDSHGLNAMDRALIIGSCEMFATLCGVDK